MRKLNLKGFGAVEVLLIIALVSIIGGVGWHAWHSNQANNKLNAITSFAECKANEDSKLQESYPEVCVTKNGKSFTNPDQKAESPNPATDTSKNNSTRYLIIKEWNVKLPLDSADTGAYYTYSKSNDKELTDSVSIFDGSIDNTKNANGVGCKDPSYPLFVISRIKPSNVAATQDMNSEYYIGDAGPNTFKYFSFTREYEFAGSSSHQSAPQCEGLNYTGGNFKADMTLDAKYSAVKNALENSYNQMQAE